MRARCTTGFLLACRGISKPQPPPSRKQAKVWDQISAFFFDQFHIGPFVVENWMVLFGVPGFILCVWLLQRGTRL